MVFTASVLYAQHERDGVEKKPASLLCPFVEQVTECLHLYVVDRQWSQTVYPL